MGTLELMVTKILCVRFYVSPLTQQHDSLATERKINLPLGMENMFIFRFHYFYTMTKSNMNSNFHLWSGHDMRKSIRN